MRRIILSLAVPMTLMATQAFAAPDVEIQCPADIRAEVTTPLPPEWIATAQSSRAQQAIVQRMGGRQVLACTYRMFGTYYTVYREFPAGHDYCVAYSTPSFGCYVPGHR